MRIVVNILMLLMVVGTGVLLLYTKQGNDLEARRIEQVRNAIATIESKSLLTPAKDNTIEKLSNGQAVMIEQSWFETVPLNPFAPENTRWMDVAKHPGLKHPEMITFGDSRAMFWYNPHLGIVRARVPQQISQGSTFEYYNRLNESSLTEQAHKQAVVDAQNRAAELEPQVQTQAQVDK